MRLVSHGTFWNPWEGLPRLCLDYLGDITVSSSNSQASFALHFLDQTISTLIVNKSKSDQLFSVNLINYYCFEMVHLFCLFRILCMLYNVFFPIFATVNFAGGPYWVTLVGPWHCSASTHTPFSNRQLHIIYNPICYFLIEDKFAVGPYWELFGCPWRVRCTHRTVYSGRSRCPCPCNRVTVYMWHWEGECTVYSTILLF